MWKFWLRFRQQEKANTLVGSCRARKRIEIEWFGSFWALAFWTQLGLKRTCNSHMFEIQLVFLVRLTMSTATSFWKIIWLLLYSIVSDNEKSWNNNRSMTKTISRSTAFPLRHLINQTPPAIESYLRSKVTPDTTCQRPNIRSWDHWFSKNLLPTQRLRFQNL
jgi:hypothetical protein